MSDERYAIAVIGGATAGAEAADIFAKQGILTVVFEQNARPYGKVEDGLPRWHEGLRAKEYGTIDQKLGQEHVHYVPDTSVGTDIGLRELTDEWGFHSVVLANGAWRDRALPIEGADAWVGKGLIYQNAFIAWFNHYHESGYDLETFEPADGTIVVGGGLASIDVAKVINLELALRALREKGANVPLAELELNGIPKTLAAHGLSWEELGYEGATIFYRRRAEDMPLVSLPDGANEKVREKIAKSRARVLEKSQGKYLFKLEPLRAPVALITEGDRLVGLEFAKTEMVEGRPRLTDQTVEVRGPQVISSIGSIPVPLAGVPMNGELYAFEDWELGRLPDYPTLFSAGNVVTGKGNIVESRKHARAVGTYVRDEYLSLSADVQKLPPITPETREALLKRVRSRQKAVAFTDYTRWIEASKPTGFV